jgi:hypothetical protein
LIETALSLAGEPLAAQEASELARLLREWDGRAAPDSIGCSAYHVFLDVLAKELFEVRLGKERLARYRALPALDLEALVSGVLDDATAGGSDVWSEPGAVREAVRKEPARGVARALVRARPGPEALGVGRAARAALPRARSPRPALGPFPYGGAPHAVLAADIRASIHLRSRSRPRRVSPWTPPRSTSR